MLKRGSLDPNDMDALIRDLFPGMQGTIVLHDDEVEAMWGLAPAWTKDADYGRTNAYLARAETITERATYSATLGRGDQHLRVEQRPLVPLLMAGSMKHQMVFVKLARSRSSPLA